MTFREGFHGAELQLLSLLKRNKHTSIRRSREAEMRGCLPGEHRAGTWGLLAAASAPRRANRSGLHGHSQPWSVAAGVGAVMT